MVSVVSYIFSLCWAVGEVLEQDQNAWNLSAKQISNARIPRPSVTRHNIGIPEIRTLPTSAASGQWPYQNSEQAIPTTWTNIASSLLALATIYLNTTSGQPAPHADLEPMPNPPAPDTADAEATTTIPPASRSPVSATIDQLLSDDEVELVARSHGLGLSPNAIAAAVQVGRMIREQGGRRDTESANTELPRYASTE